MNVEEVLYFFRKKRKLRQSDIFDYIDSTVYSKIESGNRFLKFSELIEILNRLSIPLNEFSEYLEESKNQRYYREIFKHCANNTKDQKSKDELLNYFYSLNFNMNMNVKDMSNYVGIKLLFSNYWKEVNQLTKSEMDIVFTTLNNREYYFEYDYALLANTIFLFSDSQINTLLKKVIPIVDIEVRNSETIHFLKNMMNNLVTTLIRKDKFESCLYYIELAGLPENKGNLDYKLVLKYLENLTRYFMTNDNQYKVIIEEYIKLLTTLGETSFANNLEKELNALLDTKKEGTIFIQTDA